MMNCVKTITKANLLLAVAAIAISFFSACTKVDDTLGADLIPDNQKMILRVDTISNAINTYQTKIDSMISTRSGYAIVGKIWSQIYGGVESSSLVQYKPAFGAFSKFKNYYGFSPSIDSVYMYLPITDCFGDTISATQSFDIYEITSPLKYDSVYYSNLDISKYTNFKKLFTFEYKGGKAKVNKIELFNVKNEYNSNITADGHRFFDRLIAEGAADTTIYKNDSLFLTKFNGLYIAPSATSPKEAALHHINLYNSSFIVHAHNLDEENPVNNKDTLHIQYEMMDVLKPYENSYYINPASSVNIFKRDYTGTAAGAGLQKDTLATSTVSNITYIDSPAGLQTFIRLTDEMVAQLTELKNKNGEYRSIVINKALLVAEMENKSIPFLNEAPSLLGMYYSNFKPIPDFAETYNQSNTYTPAYGGTLNRNHGYYTMDITSYVQKLLIKEGNPEKEEVKKTIHISIPFEYNLGYKRVALKGKESMKLILTYTLIK